MDVAIERQAGAQIDGVNALLVKQSAVINAGQARASVDQNFELELAANKQIYVSQVDAAGQIRSAGLDAAKLLQPADVTAAVGREISRDVDKECAFGFEIHDNLIR